MSFALDPEIASVMLSQVDVAAGLDLQPPGRGDALGLRAMAEPALAALFEALPRFEDVLVEHHSTPADDGGQVELRWYTTRDAGPGPGVIYVHGGGMICGTLDIYEPLVRHYVHLARVPFLAVEYRRAPEVGRDAPARDCLAAVRWLRAKASELAVDQDRIAIMGDSGGGGIAAATAILSREAGIHLAKQILVFPMLDDRNVEPDPHLTSFATWTYDNNFTGWHALLGDDIGTERVMASSAPARLVDFSGLAAAYLEVGELDIFRDEVIAYGQRLLKAGVSCELHVHHGAPHGFDWFKPDSGLSTRVLADRLRVLGAV